MKAEINCVQKKKHKLHDAGWGDGIEELPTPKNNLSTIQYQTMRF